MGNSFEKCVSFVFVSRPREIITEGSLRAVYEIAEYLKLNVQNRNMFRDTGNQRSVRQIAGYIGTGYGEIRNVLLERNPVEVAAGLQYFLVRLHDPLLPKYMQDLALEVEEDMQPEIVAEDILGLIRQDLKGRHIRLIFILLDLLCYLRKHAISDEISGSNVPVALLPVFFTLQPQHLQKWRTIANIFMEMIDLSPTLIYLSPDLRPINDSGTGSTVSETFRLMEEEINEQEINLEDNMVLHQVLIRSGSEGDANFPEIVPRIRTDHRKLLNPVFGYFVRRFR